MEELVTLENVTTGNVITINEKLQLKAVFQIALFLYFGNCNDYDYLVTGLRVFQFGL